MRQYAQQFEPPGEAFGKVDVKEAIGPTGQNFGGRDIGGDQQQIYHLNTQYSDVKFRLVLVPVYLAAFSYKNKIYRYVIHGQSGKTYGERPWSWFKIITTVLLVAAVIAGFFIYQR